MIDRPTPETDVFSVSFKSIDDQAGKKKWVPADFASRLERERDEAREALKRIYQASMVAKSQEEDFAEWEKGIEMLLDLIKKGGALEEIK